MIKLFVVGFPLDIQDAELIEMFAIQGMVHSIHLITDKFTHKHKGYGFIEMVDQAGADRAIAALNGIILKGRKITVKLADEDREKKPRTFKSNRFDSIDQKQESSAKDQFKSKRPRKLISE
ncbi:MAG: RNA-binding protein [Pedobacter sp.]|nr:MAG: RNA-binding protein [Pedobacter sp.]